MSRTPTAIRSRSSRRAAASARRGDGQQPFGRRAAGEDSRDTGADAARGHGFAGYVGTGWEKDRVAILREIEQGDFFQTVRSGLVTGLYNQKEVWPLFGYEGESFSKGGYIDRGFDDIAWL